MGDLQLICINPYLILFVKNADDINVNCPVSIPTVPGFFRAP